jgi:hypothetical protein
MVKLTYIWEPLGRQEHHQVGQRAQARFPLSEGRLVTVQSMYTNSLVAVRLIRVLLTG